MVVNYQSDRCENGTEFIDAHFIHDNVVDCSIFRSRGIGIYDLSWDPRDASEEEPEPTYVCLPLSE